MGQEVIKEYIHEYVLNASESNARKEMPLTLLAQRVIEIATEHADILGVGFDVMMEDNLAWVLSRMSIEMTRMPRVREKYSITTWIENYNRHYSERNMEIAGGDGEVIGYVRTIWFAIDLNTRAPGDLSKLESLALTESDRPCPIAKQGRLRPISEPTHVGKYRFRYSDIDFNRHVNSVKYMELLLNQWSLEYHETHDVARFEIAYLQETHFDDDVKINIAQVDKTADAEIVSESGVSCRARIVFG